MQTAVNFHLQGGQAMQREDTALNNVLRLYKILAELQKLKRYPLRLFKRCICCKLRNFKLL